jgi:adenosylcobinamide-phosphate synthase
VADRTSLALGLLAGAVADAALGDPRRAHPVAAFGIGAAALEQRIWRDSRLAGAGYAALCVGAAVALGHVLERFPRARPASVAVATWAVVGGTSLRREAAAVHRLLTLGDLARARVRVTHLVGRDPSAMDESEVARAVVESVAENTSDAVVAPLLWGAAFGIPGLLGYRAVNTLDAMVGHRSPRYARFGWASARADDLANLVPARVTATLVAVLSGRPREVWRVVQAGARRHPSPNSGWCEAAFAGALELRLGGTNVYSGRIQRRPVLGDGKPPVADDIPRASELAARTTAAAALLAAAVAVVRR